MKRGRWAVALQLVLWVLLAPPLILVTLGLRGWLQFVYVFFLAACTVVFYFFNFRPCDRNVDTARKFVIYLLVMAAVTSVAGALYLLATFVFVMKNGM